MVSYNTWPFSDFRGLHVKVYCASGFLKALEVFLTLFSLKPKGYQRHSIKIVLSIFKYSTLYSSMDMASSYQS